MPSLTRPCIFTFITALLCGAVTQAQEPTSADAGSYLARVLEFENNGNVNAAVIELKNAIRDDPDDTEARYQLARLYLELLQPNLAETELRRAVALGRSDFDTQLALAETRLMMGEYTPVFTELSPELGPDPKSRAAAWVLYGQGRLEQEDANAALVHFGSALDEVPDHAPALLGLAQVSLAQGDVDTAEKWLARAENSTSAKDQAEILNLKGQIALRNRDFDTATEAFQQAADLKPYQLVRLRPLAQAQLNQGQLEQAKETLDKLLAASPGDPAGIYLLSYIALLEKDYQKAANLADQLLIGQIDEPGALFVSGASAFFLGQNEQARDRLEQYLARRPSDSYAMRLLGRTLLRGKDYQEAFQHIDPVARNDGDNVPLITLAGTAAMLSGNTDAGLAYLRRAAALSPNDAKVARLAAAAEVAAGDRESGIAALESAVESDVELQPMAIALAQEYLRSSDFDRAAVAAQRLTQQQPDQPKFQALRAFALLGQGDLDGAEEAFKKLLELTPNDADAMTGLAETYLRRGDADAARTQLQAVLALTPDDTKTLINLARIEFSSQNPEQAIALLQQGLADNPDDVDLRVALVDAYTGVRRPLSALDTLAGAQSDADDPRLLAARGRAELVADRPAAAVATLSRLAEASPDSANAHLLLATAHRRAGALDQAREQIDAALSIGNDAPIAARIASAQLAFSRPDPSEQESQAALSELSALTETHGQDARVVELRGLFAFRAKRPDEAIELLRAAHQALHSSDSAVSLAEVLWLLKRDDEAVATLTEWVQRLPGDNYVRLRLARIQLGTGQFAAAADNMQEALNRGAERPDLKPTLAWALMRAGRLQDAKPYARDAYAQDRDNPLLLHTMGFIALDEGRAPEAIDLLEQAIRESPSPSARLRLDHAKALVRANKPDQARSALNALLASEQLFPERGEAQALRASLGR